MSASPPTTSPDAGAQQQQQQQQQQQLQPKPLINRPETKLPAIPKGSRIHKRPLPIPPPRRNLNTRVLPGSISHVPDSDGYIPPPRAPYTVIIKVASSASFMSLVKRVRKALEANASRQRQTKGLPLAAQIAALNVAKGRGAGATTTGPIEDALDDVVLIATGRAIQKAIEVGAYFTREQDLVVLARTRTVQAIDDIEMMDEDADEEDSVRVRQVSCVEVGVRWS